MFRVIPFTMNSMRCCSHSKRQFSIYINKIKNRRDKRHRVTCPKSHRKVLPKPRSVLSGSLSPFWSPFCWTMLLLLFLSERKYLYCSIQATNLWAIQALQKWVCLLTIALKKNPACIFCNFSHLSCLKVLYVLDKSNTRQVHHSYFI